MSNAHSRWARQHSHDHFSAVSSTCPPTPEGGDGFAHGGGIPGTQARTLMHPHSAPPVPLSHTPPLAQPGHHQVQEWVDSAQPANPSYQQPSPYMHRGASASTTMSGVRGANNTPAASLHSVLNDMENDLVGLTQGNLGGVLEFAGKATTTTTRTYFDEDPVTLQLGCSRCGPDTPCGHSHAHNRRNSRRDSYPRLPASSQGSAPPSGQLSFQAPPQDVPSKPLPSAESSWAQWEDAVKQRDDVITNLAEDTTELRRQLSLVESREAASSQVQRSEMDEMLQKMKKQQDVTFEYKQAIEAECEKRISSARSQIQEECEARHSAEMATLLRIEAEKEAETILHQEEFRREARDSVALLIQKQQADLRSQLEGERKTLQADLATLQTTEKNLQLRVAASEAAEAAFTKHRAETEAALSAREESLTIHAEKLELDQASVTARQNEFAQQKIDYESSLAVMKEKTVQLSNLSRQLDEREESIVAGEERVRAKRTAIEETAHKIEERDTALEILAGQLNEKEASIMQASAELTSLQEQLEARRKHLQEWESRTQQEETKLNADRARHEEVMRSGLQRLADQHMEGEKHTEAAKAAVHSLREGAQKEAEAVRTALAKQQQINEVETANLTSMLVGVEEVKRDLNAVIEQREAELLTTTRLAEQTLSEREAKIAERERLLSQETHANTTRTKADGDELAEKEAKLVGGLKILESELKQKIAYFETQEKQLIQEKQICADKTTAAEEKEAALQTHLEVVEREREDIKQLSAEIQRRKVDIDLRSEDLQRANAETDKHNEDLMRRNDAAVLRNEEARQEALERQRLLNEAEAKLSLREADLRTQFEKVEDLRLSISKREAALEAEQSDLKKRPPPIDPPSSHPSTIPHENISISPSSTCRICRSKISPQKKLLMNCGNKQCTNMVQSVRRGTLCAPCEAEGVVLRGDASCADSLDEEGNQSGTLTLVEPYDDADTEAVGEEFQRQHSNSTSRRQTLPVVSLHASVNSALLSQNSLADTGKNSVSLCASSPPCGPHDDLFPWLCNTEAKARQTLEQLIEENWLLTLSDMQHTIMVENDIMSKMGSQSRAPSRNSNLPAPQQSSFSLSSSPVGGFTLPPRSMSPLPLPDGIVPLPNEIQRAGSMPGINGSMDSARGERSSVNGAGVGGEAARATPGSALLPGMNNLTFSRQMSYSQRSAASSPSPVDLSLHVGSLSAMSSSINSPLQHPQTPIFSNEFPSLMDNLWGAREDSVQFEEAWGVLKSSVQRDTTFAARLGFKLNTELKDVRLQLEDTKDIILRLDEMNESLQCKVSELTSEKRQFELQYDYAAEQIRQHAEDVKGYKAQLEEMKTNNHWRERELLKVLKENKTLGVQNTSKLHHATTSEAFVTLCGRICTQFLLLHVSFWRMHTFHLMRSRSRSERQMTICRKAALRTLESSPEMLLLSKYYQLLAKRPQRRRRLQMLQAQSGRQHLSMRFRLWCHYVQRRFLEERHNESAMLVATMRSMRRLRRANKFADRYSEDTTSFLISDNSPRGDSLS